ncbi:hypothetical protein GGTG_11986 [Gaeumannomyces tritici R3-111a-1]|uniref:Uncharacterized protein n=1 Tax=Gaeumannomyces tritici (strain R3-111a-1) TaxID=644352 RepID=J3PEQ5_GAET3|nr:hypothetical protein GGTG_11986 [Gaeumannomyces tritici R3-111a-1]EJT70963.1 hypothetical protein GGTG_11986 [Gaeumannomyces tritici R3-111a-1]
MADPLSIAGLAIGALQASAQTSSALLDLYSSLKNAPYLIAALSSEASDTRTVLMGVQGAMDALSKLPAPQAAESLQSLQRLVKDAKARLADLDALVTKLEAEKGSAKRIKLVLQKSNAASLGTKLREARTKISDVLASSTSVSASHMQLEIASIKLMVPQGHSETQAKVDGLCGVTENVLNTVKQNADDLLPLVQEIRGTSSAHTLALSRHDQQFNDLSIIMQAMLAEQSWSSFKARFRSQPAYSKQSTQQTPDPRPSQSHNRRGGSVSSQALFLVDLRPSMARCDDDCPCCCHRAPSRGAPSRLIPAMLKTYLGGLFFGYTGRPDTIATCDSRYCAKEKKAQFLVTYAFPACGICPIPLGAFLSSSAQDPSFDIDAVNDLGYSALELACSRGDEASVRDLIHHGADYSAADCLYAAVKGAAHDDSIITALVEAGADIRSYGPSVLLAAAQKNNAAVIQLLVGIGVPMDDSTTTQPLGVAAVFDNAGVVWALCELGANVNARDIDGDTALHLSVAHNCHSALRVLLEYGADYHLGTKTNRTILDLAACWGDVATMDMLSELDLRGFDVSNDNYNGKFMRQRFQNRFLPPTDDLLEAFERLFAAAVRASLKPWHGEASGSEAGAGDAGSEGWEISSESSDGKDNEDDEDLFFDAEESTGSRAADNSHAERPVPKANQVQELKLGRIDRRRSSIAMSDAGEPRRYIMGTSGTARYIRSEDGAKELLKSRRA